MGELIDYQLRINGAQHEVTEAWLGENLLYVLRERLGLPGSKNACEQGECGSCSVLMDGTLVCACMVLAASAVGADIVTVEGLSPGGRELSDIQAAFLAEGAVQCGFCTPGLVVSVHDLLERNPDPTELEVREAISGNLCRCTGYGRILAAVRAAQEARQGVSTDPSAARARPARRERGAARRHPEGPRAVRLLLRPVRGGHALGPPGALASSRRRASAASTSPGALQIPGVRAVLTAEDVPGRKTYGLDYPDQPVFAWDVVRYMGEPVAGVAADHPETARRAAAAIVVDYDPTEPLVDPEAAAEAEPIHPLGNVLHRQRIRRGDPGATGAVVVEGRYETGMQDQAFMGPESGLAIPAEDGGVDLYIATQWLHVDQDQIAACLGLPLEQVRLHLAGVGGAFGAREDLSMQVQICLLALRTGRPVKMVYSREESFFGHVHRHPAVMWYRHHADADGRLVKVEARIILDGGAYLSSSTAVSATPPASRAVPTGSRTPSSTRWRSAPTTPRAGP